MRSLLPGRNNYGIDFSGCEEVRIKGCTVISDDDAIVIKSQTSARENRNIKVINNVCRALTCYGSKAIELYSVDGSESSDIAVEDARPPFATHDAPGFSVR